MEMAEGDWIAELQGPPVERNNKNRIFLIALGVVAILLIIAFVAVGGIAQTKPGVGRASDQFDLQRRLALGQVSLAGDHGVHYTGTVTVGGGAAMPVDIKVLESGQAIGTIGTNTSQASVLGVANMTFIKANKDFWANVGNQNDLANQLNNTWTRISNNIFGLDPVTDLIPSKLAYDLDPAGDPVTSLSRVDGKEINGTKNIGIKSGDITVYLPDKDASATDNTGVAGNPISGISVNGKLTPNSQSKTQVDLSLAPLSVADQAVVLDQIRGQLRQLTKSADLTITGTIASPALKKCVQGKSCIVSYTINPTAVVPHHGVTPFEVIVTLHRDEGDVGRCFGHTNVKGTSPGPGFCVAGYRWPVGDAKLPDFPAPKPKPAPQASAPQNTYSYTAPQNNYVAPAPRPKPAPPWVGGLVRVPPPKHPAHRPPSHRHRLPLGGFAASHPLGDKMFGPFVQAPPPVPLGPPPPDPTPSFLVIARPDFGHRIIGWQNELRFMSRVLNHQRLDPNAKFNWQFNYLPVSQTDQKDRAYHSFATGESPDAVLQVNNAHFDALNGNVLSKVFGPSVAARFDNSGNLLESFNASPDGQVFAQETQAASSSVPSGYTAQWIAATPAIGKGLTKYLHQQHITNIKVITLVQPQ